MGHLSNPIGIRLSIKKKWENTWFIKNLYYPEFINGILNVRDYLYYYMTRKKMLYAGICLSHFFLIKFNKKYLIKIFFYHINLEKFSYDFINKIYVNYYALLNKATMFNYRLKKKCKIIKDVNNADIFVFFFTFFNSFLKIKKNKKIKFNYNVYKKKLKLIFFLPFLIKFLYKNLILNLFKSRGLRTNVGR